MKPNPDLDLFGCAMAAIIATVAGCYLLAQIFGPFAP